MFGHFRAIEKCRGDLADGVFIETAVELRKDVRHRRLQSRHDVVLHVRLGAQLVEALLRFLETGDLFDQLRIRVAEIAGDGGAMLHQLRRVVDELLLVAEVELHERVLRRHVQLDDGEEDVGMEVEITDAMLEEAGVAEEMAFGELFESFDARDFFAHRPHGANQLHHFIGRGR